MCIRDRVKVFCHEEKSLEQFRRLNRELRDSADSANTFSNITMPVNANLGNISYVLCAVVGAVLALNGFAGLTLGTLISFLTLNKNSTQPVSQISQQTNSIVMAMAGAQRVFDLMDEQPEEDHGYVELVNAREAPDGSLTETEERTGIWTWKMCIRDRPDPALFAVPKGAYGLFRGAAPAVRHVQICAVYRAEGP